MVVATCIYPPIPIPYFRRIEDLPRIDRVIMEEYRKNQRPSHEIIECAYDHNGTDVPWSPPWKYKKECGQLPIYDHVANTGFQVKKAGNFKKPQ